MSRVDGGALAQNGHLVTAIKHIDAAADAFGILGYQSPSDYSARFSHAGNDLRLAIESIQRHLDQQHVAGAGENATATLREATETLLHYKSKAYTSVDFAAVNDGRICVTKPGSNSGQLREVSGQLRLLAGVPPVAERDVAPAPALPAVEGAIGRAKSSLYGRLGKLAAVAGLLTADEGVRLLIHR